MNRRPTALAAGALATLLAATLLAGAASCTAGEAAPTPGAAPSPATVLSRQWEFVGHESDGDDLIVSVRLFAPVGLTVVLDGERAPDESKIPETLGIASFRFRNVTAGDHSVRVTDAAGNGESRGINAGPPTAVVEGADFLLKVGEQARVGATGPVIAFKGVAEDSRCPTDAVCARAGEAVVVLAVGGTEVRVTVPRQGEGTATAAGLGITVSGLEPLPSSTRSIDPAQYRATVRVRAQAAP